MRSIYVDEKFCKEFCTIVRLLYSPAAIYDTYRNADEAVKSRLMDAIIMLRLYGIDVNLVQKTVTLYTRPLKYER